jgi:hypothetical protein
MDKFSTWFVGAAAGMLALAGFPWGPHGSTTFPIGEHGTTTHREENHDNYRHATSTTNIDITCVTNAVAARESSLGTALTTYAGGITGAYSKRASDLAAAYALTGNDQIRAAVKVAWKTFTTAVKGARSAWQKSKASAWTTFRTAIKGCGPGASSVADTSN